MARRKDVEELGAKVTVEDKASKEFERITKSVQKTHNELMRMKVSMEKLRQQSNKKIKPDVDTKKAVHEVGKLEKAYHALHRAVSRTKNLLSSGHGMHGGMGGGLMNSWLGPTLLFGGMYAGKQTFDSTFLNAANYEMSAKTIEAMFNDKKKSDLYMKSMEQMAIGSPLLNSQDIFGNSKSFIALSKNQGQLDQMWDLAERLLAVDPKQGVEGSVFALRELFSGDSRSMAERFELSKSVLNDIKNLPIEKQLKELDKYFTKMGMTKKLVNEMGDTTLGVWNQIKETMEVGLRKIGDPAVKIIKPLLDDINKGLQAGKGNNLIKIGQDLASSIATGFVTAARGIGGWVEGIYNNPDFQKLTSIQAKVGFVFEDITKRFSEWYEAEGKLKVQEASNTIVQTMLSSLEASMPVLVPIAVQIGTAIGQGLISGLDAQIKSSGIYTAILGSPQDKNAYVRKRAVELVGKFAVSAGEKTESVKNSLVTSAVKYLFNKTEQGSPKAFGMKRVPRNNFPALLHEGERVLTKQEANQSSGGSISIAKLADQIIVREEADIDRITTKLVTRIEQELVSYGGAAY
ncbi:hypothetical protein M3175_01525 [Robertmurraya korlensis]|uniref:hypothetical protein n=1 Tax=Robertmurraya korlensis TaxID=519977 RepID=UPI00203B37A0|nr:hypothetical protein [Robertmurraya korlensis]MCM3599395.1 hypothetical protein [Robertmurraya korlensis]